VRITRRDFLADAQGRRFTDVANDPHVNFDAWLEFFSDPRRQQALEDAEMRHQRPALAGVIIELENTPVFESYLAHNDAHVTRRGRQAIGVIVRLVMEARGWRTTGHKGSLGQRERVRPGAQAPGSYRNKSGLSQWFTRAEHYRPRE